MMKKHIVCWVCLWSAILGLQAQSDSLLQPMDELGLQDLILEDSLLFKTQVRAASRSLQNVSDLPFPIYVIQRSEILSNGYITLADALKSLPGIRVSQPGSALEGETFTMRGLLGNAYAKILINGQSVKPYVVSGMPIGAQLPIQQAERIEVIYGPGAALYGVDASAGIINIVIAESERPIFTKASLHIGSDNYKSLNLLFGGKIGKGKDVVRFKLYGSDTRFDDRRVIYNQTLLYDPLNYVGPASDSSDILEDPNFRRPRDTANFVAQNMPHASRSLGGEVRYRFLTISALSMNREDHSAIGLNPAAVDYSNPLISTGENITTAVAKSRFELGRIHSETTFEFLSYQMDNRSTQVLVHPTLNALLNSTITDSTNVEGIKNDIENAYFSGFRFMGANSREFSLEQTLNIPLFLRGDATIGVKYLRGNGHAIREFQSRVVNFDQGELVNLLPAFSDQRIEEFSAFAQMFQPIGKKINLLIGGQYLNRSNGDFAEPMNVFNPRLALLYKVSKAIQLRASFGTAVRAPSPYFAARSYAFTPGEYETLGTGSRSLAAENTRSFELGMRWSDQKQASLDLNVSYTRTDQFINYNIVFDSLGPNRRLSGFSLGYFNDENSSSELFDVQAYLRLRDLIPDIKLGSTLNVNYSAGSESLTTTNLSFFENDALKLSDVRAHPNVIARLSVFANPIPAFLIRIDQYVASRSLTRNSFRLNALQRMQEEVNLYNPGYYTIDVSLNYEINKNFLFYVKLFNLLNAKYAGIDASSSNDVLFYNPQSLFTFHMGLTYELN